VGNMRLLIPGPVEAEDSVLDALSAQTIPHYGPVFMALFHDTTEKLQRLFETKGDVIMVPGPGTAAIDAAVGSLIMPGSSAVVVNNGFFGTRLAQITRAYGVHVHELRAPWGQPVLASDLRALLKDVQPKAERDGAPVHALVLVHHETSTGVLNPLEELASAGREHGLAVIVDAVASWGGVRIPVDAWGIDACISVGNKCLGAPPGVAVAAISERAWQMAAENPAPHGWYLNLKTWRYYMDEWDWHPYPTTMPTNNIAALNRALGNVFDKGVDEFRVGFTAAAERARAGLGRLGFTLFPEPGYAAPVISAMNGQPGVDLNDMLRYLRDERGYMLGGGIADLHGKIFRVGHMGLARMPEVVDGLIEATADYLSERAPIGTD